MGDYQLEFWDEVEISSPDDVVQYLREQSVGAGRSLESLKILPSDVMVGGQPTFTVLVRIEKEPNSNWPTWVHKAIALPEKEPLLDLSSYLPGSGPSNLAIWPQLGQADWGWVLLHGLQALKHFLNFGNELVPPIQDCYVCAFSESDGTDHFVVFYLAQSRTAVDNLSASPGWECTFVDTAQDAVEVLNGKFGPLGLARVMTTEGSDSSTRFYVLWRKKHGQQPSNKWTVWTFPNWGDAVAFVDGSGLRVGVSEGSTEGEGNRYPLPARDGKSMCVCSSSVLVFCPETVAIVARDVFCQAFAEYTAWQFERGIEVWVVSADWALSLDGLDGIELRFRIRSVLRDFFDARSCRNAILVGDSASDTLDATVPPALFAFQHVWDMPIGYYDVVNSREPLSLVEGRTSLFYSDISDKTTYERDKGEYKYTGAYEIRVGILPVRDNFDLGRITKKICACYVHQTCQYVVREEFWKSKKRSVTDYQKLAVEEGISFDVWVVPDSLAECGEIKAFLKAQKGVVASSGHGIGGNTVTLGECEISFSPYGNEFDHVFAGWVLSGCTLAAYGLEFPPKGIVEALLVSERGPATVVMPPSGNLPYFWASLFSGSTVGEAFEKAAYGTWYDESPFLFGDPTFLFFPG